MAAPYHPPRGAAACSPALLKAAHDAAPALARLRARGLPRVTPGELLPFVLPPDPAPIYAPPAPGLVDEVAWLYLRTPHAPNGLAKSLAAEKGLNYGHLMNRICELRRLHRFAL